MDLDEAIVFLEPETGKYSQAMLAIARAVKALQLMQCRHDWRKDMDVPVCVHCGFHA